jgi:hypothetical protein
MGVQTLGSQRSVEGFDVSIVRRFPWPAEVDAYSVLIRPQVHDLAGELCAIIAEKHLRYSAARTDLIEDIDHIRTL